MAAAYAHELPRFGVKVGLTNYAAAYCTGLLCARRLLKKIGIADKFVGQVEANGEMFTVDEADEIRPFKAVLDVGLRRTSTGARIFSIMKGAVDGGLFVPHSEKRFAGFAEGKLDSEVLRKYIFGGHVADYMRTMKEEEPEQYSKKFSQFVKAGVEADDLEGIYKKAHQAIRADPDRADPEAAKKKPFNKPPKKQKLTLQQRKERINRIIASHE